MSNVKFLILYIILMVPTYFWRFVLIGSAMDGGDDFERLTDTVMVLFLLSYVGMALVSYFRGKQSGKKYLFAFPIVGAVFDLILIFIPFAPTVMNIITIVMGMSDTKEVDEEPSSISEREEIECPACAELILKKAKKCKHCGYEINAS
jgi:CDP-diglyceride synthetase